MGNCLRHQPMPTHYGEHKTPVADDELQVGMLCDFGIIAVSFIVILPGIRGWERLWTIIQVFVALWIGAVLLMCNFGTWYSDTICTRTQYKAHTSPNTPQIIQATVGISISLRGVNVTLKETEDGCGSEEYVRPFPGEKIHYVENFNWAPSWAQGRLDFGVFGGQYRQTFRAAQQRGMPYPIAWVAETFLFDGEQFRWYRKFRMAGFYTHIWLWTGFATYLFTILLFVVNIQRGAQFMFLTGAMLCLAPLTYSVLIQNDPPLQIHFPDAILRPQFNYPFYLTTVTGVLTILGAAAVAIMNIIFPRKMAAFFHHAYIEDDTFFEGELEEEGSEEGQSSNKGAEGKFRRKRILTHLRESVRSTKSLGGRSDVFPRDKSETPHNISPATQQKNKAIANVQGDVVLASLQGNEVPISPSIPPGPHPCKNSAVSVEVEVEMVPTTCNSAEEAEL